MYVLLPAVSHEIIITLQLHTSAQCLSHRMVDQKNPGLTHSSDVRMSRSALLAQPPTRCTMGSQRGKAVEARSCSIHLHVVPK